MNSVSKFRVSLCAQHLLPDFPGETDEHFKHLLEFVREIEFDHVGVFTYFHEEGTTAYNYQDLVPNEIAVSRRDELMSLQQEINRKKNMARIGQVLPVLIEGADPEEEYLITGRLATQAPEIDGQVIIEETVVEIGQIVTYACYRINGLRSGCTSGGKNN